MYTPVNPSFTIQKWGVRGYKSHGNVILMLSKYQAFQSLLVNVHCILFVCHDAAKLLYILIISE